MAKNQSKSYIKEALTILAVLFGTALLLFSIWGLPRVVSIIKDRLDTPPVHSAELNETVITDTETGIKYVRCPIGIGADKVKDKFLVIGDKDKGIVLYTILFEDSAKFISEAKNALGGAFVYRAETEKEITIEDFDPVSAGIYMDGINAPIDHFYGKDALDKNTALEDGTKYVKLIKNALTEGKAASSVGELTDTAYYIRLYSKNYPGLYYEVMFCTDVNGVCYLQDLVTDKLVIAPDELTVRIMG